VTNCSLILLTCIVRRNNGIFLNVVVDSDFIQCFLMFVLKCNLNIYYIICSKLSQRHHFCNLCHFTWTAISTQQIMSKTTHYLRLVFVNEISVSGLDRTTANV